MFQRGRRGALKRAIEEAGDYELRELRGQVAHRQDKVAQLELELFDTRSELVLFERELENKLGTLKRRKQELLSLIDQAHFQAQRRAQWGDRVDSPDMHEDVVKEAREMIS